MINLMNFISSTALSFTFSGNTGIAPFLTLFLIGAIEKADPELLNMGGTLESLLSTWTSLVILALLAVLELIGHCVPVVDEVMDSAVTFIVPIISILGTMSTFGLLEMAEVDEEYYYHQRLLFLNTFTSGAMLLFKIVIIFVGIGLALSMHLFKMLVRLAGEGCLTQILTVAEITYVILTIMIATYIRPFALVTGSIILLTSGYSFKRRYWDGRKKHEENQIDFVPNTENVRGEVIGGDYVNVTDVETAQPVQEQSDKKMDAM